MASTPATTRKLRIERLLRLGLRVLLGAVLLGLLAVVWHRYASSDDTILRPDRWVGETDTRRSVEVPTQAGRLRSFSAALLIRCRGETPEVMVLKLASADMAVDSGRYMYGVIRRRTLSGRTVTVTVDLLIGDRLNGTLHAAGGNGMPPAAAACRGDATFGLRHR